MGKSCRASWPCNIFLLPPLSAFAVYSLARITGTKKSRLSLNNILYRGSQASLWPAYQRLCTIRNLECSFSTPSSIDEDGSMPPVAPGMLCNGHDNDSYSYLDKCLVQGAVIARTVNLYHKVAKEPCTFYPSCVCSCMHASSTSKHTLEVEDMPTHNKQVLSLFPCFGDVIEGALFALHQAVEEVPFGWVHGAVVCLLTGFPVCTQQSMCCQAKHKPASVHN